MCATLPSRRLPTTAREDSALVRWQGGFSGKQTRSRAQNMLSCALGLLAGSICVLVCLGGMCENGALTVNLVF